MNRASVAYFQCPGCGASGLEMFGENGRPVLEGELRCGRCSASYPIKNGIPRFLTASNCTDSFGYQWNRYSRTQLDSYTGCPVSRKRLFEATGWPENLEGQVVLEAGSGAGRFTEVLLSTGAEVFSFDSSSAVEANWSNNGHCSRLNLFQCDLFRLPLRKMAFDKVLCLGVIQHTPDPEEAFESLAEQVRPGGELVIDVYTKRVTSLLHWKYLLRPLTKRMDKEKLHKAVERAVDGLLPLAQSLRQLAGRLGTRLVPIVEYSYLGLPPDLNREWAILDTFDMYSPAYDRPQSIRTVERWFKEANFVHVTVRPAPNGLAGKGRRPEQPGGRCLQVGLAQCAGLSG